MRARTDRQAGFTLIELLTVIAIICVLAGLIMTAVMSAQESGRAASCRNNLKQLHQLVLQYTGTFGGYLPTFWHERWVGELGLVGQVWGNLPDDIKSYTGGPFKGAPLPVIWNNLSPANYYLWDAKERPILRSGSPTLLCRSDLTGFRCDQGCLLSYMGLAKYGYWWRGANLEATQPVFLYHQITEYEDPSKRLLFLETEPSTWQFDPGACGCRWHSYSHPIEILRRHYGGGNVVFHDGHTELVRDKEKRQIAYWEPDYQSVRPETMGW